MKESVAVAPAHCQDADEDVTGVLRRAGSACHDLASTTEWLQDQLSSLVEAGRIEPCRETSMALQELDRIAQVLHGLAKLSVELGEHTVGKSAPRSRLAAAIRLDSLAARILDGSDPDNVEDEFW